MDVYEPAEDSFLLQKYVEEHAFGRVLDIGTGSGIQALTAADCKNVREVVAVDINKRAIKELSAKRNRKVRAIESDLFSQVNDKFNLIIFNPPYLPQDLGINDPALYGGEKGWEVSEKFFSEVSDYLISNGKILFLFSSLTDKDKIEEMISGRLLDFQELATEKLPLFETLYVYLIEKSQLLIDLERKNVFGINYLTHGKRGNIFIGQQDKSTLVKTHFAKSEIVKVAIKVKRAESKAINRMSNEVNWLKLLNKKNIGPKLLFYGEDYFVYEYVEGSFILDWVKGKSRKKVVFVLINVLNQCFIMDKMGVSKEEMHHPFKHVLVDKFSVPILIDFERCSRTEKPKNVTQFIEFISRGDLGFDIEILRSLAKKYKKDFLEESFNKIVSYLQS
jgi:release factor glutamine methyltransferase